MELSSNLTAVAEVSIPDPFDPPPLLTHHAAERVQFRRIKPEALSHSNFRLQPELRFVAAATDMHMRRLSRVTLVREEIEPIALAFEDRRHEASKLNCTPSLRRRCRT